MIHELAGASHDAPASLLSRFKRHGADRCFSSA
jgi:hypothetical protein